MCAPGAIEVDDDAEPQDRIGGEVFDTPDFSASAAGSSNGSSTG